MKPLKLIAFSTLLLLCTSMFSQQLVYQPINPNFGGNYLNYNWLLASANAQNQFKEDRSQGLLNNSTLDGFSDSMKRQILNQLSREFFKGDELEDNLDAGNGTFQIGGLVISIEETGSGVLITIIDSDTGESTEIVI